MTGRKANEKTYKIPKKKTRNDKMTREEKANWKENEAGHSRASKGSMGEEWTRAQPRSACCALVRSIRKRRLCRWISSQERKGPRRACRLHLGRAA